MRQPHDKAPFAEDEFPLQALTGTIIASAFHVFQEFGYGFRESVYKRALAVELTHRGVRVDEEVPYDLFHRGVLIGRYRADTVAELRVIVETKTGPLPDPEAPGQLLNYLCATKIGLGLVVYFSPRGVKVKRVIATDPGAAARGRRMRRRRGIDT